MIKVQLWENKELFKANEGLEKPIIGLLHESTFNNFKYLKDTIKIVGASKTFIAVPVYVFNSSILVLLIVRFIGQIVNMKRICGRS